MKSRGEHKRQTWSIWLIMDDDELDLSADQTGAEPLDPPPPPPPLPPVKI